MANPERFSANHADGGTARNGDVVTTASARPSHATSTSLDRVPGPHPPRHLSSLRVPQRSRAVSSRRRPPSTRSEWGCYGKVRVRAPEGVRSGTRRGPIRTTMRQLARHHRATEISSIRVAVKTRGPPEREQHRPRAECRSVDVDLDQRVRDAAFQFLDAATQRHGEVPDWELLTKGFTFDGHLVPLLGASLPVLSAPSSGCWRSSRSLGSTVMRSNARRALAGAAANTWSHPFAASLLANRKSHPLGAGGGATRSLRLAIRRSARRPLHRAANGGDRSPQAARELRIGVDLRGRAPLVNELREGREVVELCGGEHGARELVDERSLIGLRQGTTSTGTRRGVLRASGRPGCAGSDRPGRRRRLADRHDRRA